ncbi:hypothetical protein DXG03_008782 [Asterophora parasitica]|uniref:Uncharacterized protein n=1 Tax=Asterophora parasitica TaxID=117018 RepID=A0A9P7FY33_9AGAR|nr:hypothetical protein DXG03_008782 [Asterophora parasitica]
MSPTGGADPSAKKQAGTFQNMCVSALALAMEDAPSGVDTTKWKAVTDLLHSLAKALEHVAGQVGIGPSPLSPPSSSSAYCSLPSTSHALSSPHALSSLPSAPSLTPPSTSPPSSVDPFELHLRQKSLVVAGLPEPDASLGLEDRCEADRKGVARLLGYLQVDTMPNQIFRMGKQSLDRPRLLKLVMPARSFVFTALKNATKLRGNSDFEGIYIRQSMTREELSRHQEMRATVRDLRAKDSASPFVVYRGEIWHKGDIPSRVRSRFPNQGNF